MAKNFPISNIENAIMSGVKAFNYVENEKSNFGSNEKEEFISNFPSATYHQSALDYADQNPNLFLMGSDTWGSKTKKVGL